MKTTIYYFTGTGNSLAIAKDIAAGLGDTELVSIPAALGSGATAFTAERIGIVFPVYMWGLPAVVADFLGKTTGLEGKYIFAVTNYGGFPGATLRQADNILKARGGKLAAGFGVKMPGNYTPMYGAKPEPTLKALFTKEKKAVEGIVKAVNEGRTGSIAANFFLTNWIFSTLIYNMGMPKIHGMDRPFAADDTCTHCGLCAKVCPVKNIEMKDGKPAWQHRCEQCMACLQWCPVEAIQYGAKTRGRKRYRHPGATAEDLYRQQG